MSEIDDEAKGGAFADADSLAVDVAQTGVTPDAAGVTADESVGGAFEGQTPTVEVGGEENFGIVVDVGDGGAFAGGSGTVEVMDDPAAGTVDSVSIGGQFDTGGSTTIGPGGLTGARGPRGERGPEGLRGNTGADGANGADGLPGAPGRDGTDGRDGIDGTNGRDGPRGEPGIQGLRGLPGTDGTNGTDGRDGVDGRDGIDGADGADGLPGIRGATGPTGLRGLRGLQGADGSDGRDGTDGRDGIDGTDGRDGSDGRDGIDGNDGMAGIAGPPGQDGTDGIDGTDGRDGVDGIDGRTGDPGPQGLRGLPGTPGQDGADGRDGIDGMPGQDGADGVDGGQGIPGQTGPRGFPGLDGAGIDDMRVITQGNATTPSVIEFLSGGDRVGPTVDVHPGPAGDPSRAPMWRAADIPSYDRGTLVWYNDALWRALVFTDAIDPGPPGTHIGDWARIGGDGGATPEPGGFEFDSMLQEVRFLLNTNTRNSEFTRDADNSNRVTGFLIRSSRGDMLIQAIFRYNDDDTLDHIEYQDGMGSTVISDIVGANMAAFNNFFYTSGNYTRDEWAIAAARFAAQLMLTENGFLTDAIDIATLTENGFLTAEGWDITANGYLMEAP